MERGKELLAMSGPEFVGELNQAFMQPTSEFYENNTQPSLPGQELLAKIFSTARVPLKDLQDHVPKV